jgi:hypothetical protein
VLHIAEEVPPGGGAVGIPGRVDSVLPGHRAHPSIVGGSSGGAPV